MNSILLQKFYSKNSMIFNFCGKKYIFFKAHLIFEKNVLYFRGDLIYNKNKCQIRNLLHLRIFHCHWHINNTYEKYSKIYRFFGDILEVSKLFNLILKYPLSKTLLEWKIFHSVDESMKWAMSWRNSDEDVLFDYFGWNGDKQILF